MQFAKFPFAEAYARLQLHYSSLQFSAGKRDGGVDGREKVASSICKFFGRARLHKSRVIVAFCNSFPFTHFSCAHSSPVSSWILNPRRPFCLIALPLFCNTSSFNADRETDRHASILHELALLLYIKESIICVIPAMLSCGFHWRKNIAFQIIKDFERNIIDKIRIFCPKLHKLVVNSVKLEIMREHCNISVHRTHRGKNKSTFMV